MLLIVSAMSAASVPASATTTPVTGFTNSTHQASSMKPTSNAHGSGQTKSSLMLPSAALQGARLAPTSGTTHLASGPAASPCSNLTNTPHNVPSTAWRTVVCPFPPARRTRHQAGSLDPTPQSSPMGITTPANLWPSPVNLSQVRKTSFSLPGAVSSTSSAAFCAAGQVSPFSVDATPILATGGASTKHNGAELAQFMDMMCSTGSDAQVTTPGATPMHLMSLDRARIFDGPPGDTPVAKDGEKGAFGPFFTSALSEKSDNPMAMNSDGTPQAWMCNLGA